MMRRLREILCRMLARTAVQPRVLLALFSAQQCQRRPSRSQLKPKRTCGFGIREKIRCGLRFLGVFLCGFAAFAPLAKSSFEEHAIRIENYFGRTHAKIN